ncbi:hypothetical protein [Alicyclobacillus fastidiosus]|uniref:Uncharacterized protein n=1 Tax=Alicyclobacillus fastidiosus TaxID=392011 RepID=A0ABV5ANY9_9BACL
MKKTLYISDEAIRMLDEYQKGLKKRGIKISDSEVTSKAIIQFVLSESQYGEQKINDVIENLLLKQFNRLASMIASVGVDVDMILADTLDQRSADYPDVPPKQVMSDLRSSAMELFKSKKSFRVSVFED